MANSEEMFDYLSMIFVGQIGLEEGQIGASVADASILIGGVRFRQQRVGVNTCTRYNDDPMVFKNSEAAGALACFGAYSPATHTNHPFGPEDNPFQWQATAPNLLAKSTEGKLTTYVHTHAQSPVENRNEMKWEW